MLDHPAIASVTASGPLPFTKMHGLGNDFLVVDLRAAASTAWFDEPAAIMALCDRRRGVGADGVLGVLPPRPAAAAHGAVARMRIRNADGSEAEMCGNGLRCVARFLNQVGVPGSALAIETGAGILACRLEADGSVEIAMGAPRPERIAQPLSIGDTTFTITTVSMGNPHAVIFYDDVADPADLRRLAERHGPGLEVHPLFPGRTNVELVHFSDDGSFDVVVWERGCGITLACGTGACAAVVAACLTGRSQPGVAREVRLLGGPLQIRVEPDYRDVHMRGPVATVYRGEVLPTR